MGLSFLYDVVLNCVKFVKEVLTDKRIGFCKFHEAKETRAGTRTNRFLTLLQANERTDSGVEASDKRWAAQARAVLL